MTRTTISWCIEAPQGNFLKELITHSKGQRLVFTDNWHDSPLQFVDKSTAEKFKKDNSLTWLTATEHMLTH